MKGKFFMRKTFVNFEKAQDYLELCNNASKTFKQASNATQTQKNNYEVLERYRDKTNCKAILYKKGDEYIVSFFGTDFKNAKDIGTNVAMVAGKIQIGKTNTD